MFAQVDSRDTRSKSGLGIGLTLARTLVQLHGGSITAISEGEGRGSRFVVRLPLIHASLLQRAAASAKSMPSECGRHRILVVDDNRDAADTLGALLQVLGAEAHIVYDGQSALAALDTFRPSVIVLDLGMPEMDGFEVARRIRARPESKDTALIALTGWGQEKDRHRTKAAGFNHHLVKPVDPNAMQTVLATLAA
jgi:CheY-like chemotaxis protein